MDFITDVLGIEPIPWQRWLFIHALELLPDGLFRFRTVLILISRQNGKTSWVEFKNLWKMFILQVPLIIGTAQNLDISEESWDKAVEIADSIPELKAEIEHVDRTNGKKALRLTNGSRWKIAAASRKGGRGLAGDDVNLDELREHRNYEAWGAVTKTTMARPNAQTYAYSNAGDDKSVVLNELRERGLAAIEAFANGELADTSLGHFEWSAPDDIRCTCLERAIGRPHDGACKLRDKAAWAQANPSLGYTITLAALESALSTDPEGVFRTECLCQRVIALEEGVITAAEWARLADPDSKRDGDLAIGADISVGRNWSSVSVYGKRTDGLGHLQLVDYHAGTAWTPARLAELKTALDPVAIGMGRGTYESLKPELNALGMYSPDDLPDEILAERGDKEPRRGDLLVTTAATMAAATGQFVDAVRQRTFRVVPAAQLDESVAGAKVRPNGAVMAWSAKDSDADLSPVGSATVARYTFVTRADAPRDVRLLEPSAFHV